MLTEYEIVSFHLAFTLGSDSLGQKCFWAACGDRSGYSLFLILIL